MNFSGIFFFCGFPARLSYMKLPIPIRIFAATVASAFVFGLSPAVADAIDGAWCNGVKRLEISGPTILTPGGNSIDGVYGRHDFTYTVPTGEAGAGANVDMDLIGDDTMRLWPNGRSPDPEIAGAQMWKRCAAPVS
tara:strand:- start:99 stop:506 length:408 start_codon:yes stop_codon:yes gene_type:complete